MKAFVLSLAALAVIGVVTAAVMTQLDWSSSSVYSTTNVRLD